MAAVVTSIEEAEAFFLRNRDGEVYGVKWGEQAVLTCYPDAEKFFGKGE